MKHDATPRLRGRRAVAQRLRRLRHEPLCRDCADRGLITLAVTPDHIVPLAKGGSDDDSNIRCLCEPCHRERTAEQFGHRKKTLGWGGGNRARAAILNSADYENRPETMPERKRGAPIGNKNAVKHGRYTAAGRAARLAALKEQQAAWKEKHRRSDEWIKTIPKTDYAAIVEGLRALAGKRP